MVCCFFFSSFKTISVSDKFKRDFGNFFSTKVGNFIYLIWWHDYAIYGFSMGPSLAVISVVYRHNNGRGTLHGYCLSALILN
jgi:hypothetical protein